MSKKSDATQNETRDFWNFPNINLTKCLEIGVLRNQECLRYVLLLCFLL